MDVLVVARHPTGGIRTYFRYVYGNQVMEPNSFTFITPGPSGKSQSFEWLKTAKYICSANDSTFSVFKTFLRTVFLSRPNVIHSHGFTAALVCSFPAWFLRIPHIATTHDVFNDTQFVGLRGYVKKVIFKKLFQLITIINPVGLDAKANFIDHFPEFSCADKIVAIRNGIDCAFFLGDERRDLRRELSLDNDALLVGFFGRFMAQKGFGVLVDAVDYWNKVNPSRPLHVACFGGGGFIREERLALEQRNLINFFHFFALTDDMPSALRGVDALIMPSRWEACPLLPMEALVAGVTVIGTDCIGMKEVLTNTPSLSFKTDSVSGLVACLEKFYSRREEFGITAISFRYEAADRFDVARCARSILSLYKSILPHYGPQT